MSRRAQAPVRTILPDPKYNNEMLAKFMNVVMKSGKVVEEGAASRIIQSPREPYTQELLASVPPFICGFTRPLPAGDAQAL